MEKAKLFTQVQVLVALNEMARHESLFFTYEIAQMQLIYIAALLDADRLAEADKEITELGIMIFDELELQGRTESDMRLYLDQPLVKGAIRYALTVAGYDPLLMERLFALDELTLTVNAAPTMKGASA